MQRNSFQTFRVENKRFLEPEDVIGREACSTVGASVSAMSQTFWLKPGYILENHCKTGANKQEKRSSPDACDESQTTGDTASQQTADNDSLDVHDSIQSSGRQKVSKNCPLTHDEIAAEAATMVYRIFTSILNRSRVASKIQIFNDLLYFLRAGLSMDRVLPRERWKYNGKHPGLLQLTS